MLVPRSETARRGDILHNWLFVEGKGRIVRLKEELHLLKMLARKVNRVEVIKTG